MTTGQACPECGRQTAGEPGAGYRTPCWCGAGAAPVRSTPDGRWAAHDDHRAARTVEIAAEDFDPLRVRPYVTLPDASHAPEPGFESPSTTAAIPATSLHLGGDGGPDAYAGTAAGAGYGATTGTGMHTVDPGPGGRHRRAPGSAPAPAPVPSQRQRPFVVLAAAAAVAAVVGTAAFAGGLFGGAEDGTDEALPETTTSVPDSEDGPAASVAPSPSTSATASRTPSASATASASPSASSSPKKKSQEPTSTGSPSASASASPGRSASATPGGGAPTGAATADPPPPAITGGMLRPGDRGPQVAELQNRLREIGRWLYSGPSDGDYTDRVAYAVAYYQSYMGVHGDPTGVYGPNTRKLLEAQTSGRDRDHGRGHGRGHR